MEKKELRGTDIFVIHEFLSVEECEHFVAQSEQQGYEEAPVNTAVGPLLVKDYRDSGRLIIHDPVLAAAWWSRAQPFLPAVPEAGPTVGFNEQFRFYRYDVGQKFAPHYDGYFKRDNGERSHLTFMVYLNEGFEGGETVFYPHGGPIVVRPERGKALVFAHRQMHEGAEVVAGRKYILRTDVMYRQSEPAG